MGLPLSERIGLFEHYNRVTWPAPVILFVVAIAMLAMILEGGWHRAIGMTMGLVWAWSALAYFVMYGGALTTAAWVFAGAFLAAANAFSGAAGSGALRFERPHGAQGWTGVLFVALGVLGYPLIALALGTPLRDVPTFGLPSPTTVVALGLLLLARRPVPIGVLVVPFGWCAVGTVAVLRWGSLPDLPLSVAGAITAAFLFQHRARAVHAPLSRP